VKERIGKAFGRFYPRPATELPKAAAVEKPKEQKD